MESPSRKMCYYPLTVFASVYQVRQKLEFGFSGMVALGRDTSAGRNIFLQRNLFIPRWGTCIVFLHGHRTEELSSPVSCGEQLSWVFPWVKLCLSYFPYKFSAFSSVQQGHVSWTLGNSPLHCTSIFKIHNVLFCMCLQVNYFDRQCFLFIIPVPVHCLPVTRYIYYSTCPIPPSFSIIARWFQWT